MYNYQEWTKAELAREIEEHKFYDNNDLSKFTKQDMIDWLENADMYN